MIKKLSIAFLLLFTPISVQVAKSEIKYSSDCLVKFDNISTQCRNNFFITSDGLAFQIDTTNGDPVVTIGVSFSDSTRRDDGVLVTKISEMVLSNPGLGIKNQVSPAHGYCLIGNSKLVCKYNSGGSKFLVIFVK